jgi:transmembrane sensor
MKREVFLKLLTRKLSGELSDAELRDFQDAMAANQEFRQFDEEFARYFESGKDGSAGGSVDLTGKLQSVWESIDQKVGLEDGPATPKIIKVSFLNKYSYALKAAAIAVILLTAGMIFFNYNKLAEKENMISVNSGGQKLFMTLDDGTKVWLNRHSSLAYNAAFGKRSREITLKGEAFFDVVKNPEVPLSIVAGRIRVVVKGTAFNVKAYGQSGNTEVALIRGLVEVSGTEEKMEDILLQPNEKFVLLPENNTGVAQYKLLKMNAELENSDTRWTQDTLVFKKEKLKDLAQQMEIRYKVKIEIQNEQLKSKRFSGLFTSEPLRDALEALKLSYPLDYQITDQKVIIK